MRPAFSFAAAAGLIALGFGATSLAAGADRWPANPDMNTGVSLSDAQRAPRCGAKTPALSVGSLGPVRPGQPLRKLEKRCPGLRYGWYWNEGSPTPVVLLRLGDSAVMIEFSDATDASTIYRITTDSPVRTVDGFGPGSRLSAMINAWGKPTFGAGEHGLYVWFSARPGLSFRVEVPDRWDYRASGRVEQSGDATLLPDGTRVGEVLLVTAN
jgi:hypothetical protein